MHANIAEHGTQTRVRCLYIEKRRPDKGADEDGYHAEQTVFARPATSGLVSQIDAENIAAEWVLDVVHRPIADQQKRIVPRVLIHCVRGLPFFHTEL